MKTLSLTQPWATLVAIGAKRIETRSWKTAYHGELAIHAAKVFKREYRELARSEPFRSVLIESGVDVDNPDSFPTGSIVSLVEVVGYAPTNNLHSQHVMKMLNDPELSERERAFGDYGRDRWMWMFGGGAVWLKHPIGCAGHQRLWSVPKEVADQVTIQAIRHL